MDPQHLQQWIADVREGRQSRRGFIHRLAALGVAAPVAAQLLMHAGLAQAQQPAHTYKPTKRGGGGTLKLLLWQGPTLLNPHFATGAKDSEACRLFYEPLAAWDPEGFLVPILAAEIPSLENGGVARDGRSVTWKLKRGVTWHDGQPFTADDCVFNAEYAKDPATAAVTIGTYKDVTVTKVDTHTIRLNFARPTPFWADAFTTRGLIPRHLFAQYRGAKSREAPANLKPVGTGPYKFVDFKPGDMVRAVLNPSYHMPNRPFFDTVELKGGGDPTSAARTVLQTGEYDWAWNLQVEDEVLKRLEDGGKGRAAIVPSADVEFMMLNFSDPWTEVDGERSSIKTKHFAFSDARVRQAIALLIDRGAIQQFIYGRTGTATSNYVNGPARYRSPNTRWEFSVDKANLLLDDAGWKRGSDGIRALGGRKLKLLLQTSVNSLRQKEQAVIKQGCQKAGIEVELKAVSASVFFSSDEANPDTNSKFYADMEVFALVWGSPDPLRAMDRFASWEVASKANKWQGRNICRWTNAEFDALYRAAESEMDPVKRTALCIRMNDMAVNAQAVIPLIARSKVNGVANKLVAPPSAWDIDFWAIQDWYREA